MAGDARDRGDAFHHRFAVRPHLGSLADDRDIEMQDAAATRCHEIDGVAQELAKEALTLGAAKLPIKTKFIQRLGGA